MPQTVDRDATGPPARPPTPSDVAYRLGCLHTAEELLRRARTWPSKKTVRFLEELCASLAQGMNEPVEPHCTGLSLHVDPEDPTLGGRWMVHQGDDAITWTITSPSGLTDTFEAAEMTHALAWIGGVLMGVRFEQRRTGERE